MGLALLHHHPYTGRVCDCGYGRPKFVGPSIRLAGVNWNRAVKQQVSGKKFQSLPGALAFTSWMDELMMDDRNGYRDEIAPFLVKEFRAGRVSFDENRQAFYHTSAPFSADPGTRLTDGLVDRYGQWAAARQHPTRRGVNITGPDFTFDALIPQVREWQRDLEEREAHQARVEDMKHSDAPVAYPYNDGWTVRDLAKAPNPRHELELEGHIMDHCIGNDGEHPHTGYDYKQAVEDEMIPHVYSLRDPEGLPHATFHMNPDGSLAEMHGFNNHSTALHKYAPRIAHFLRERHPQVMASNADSYTRDDMERGEYPWHEEGNNWEPPSRFASSYTVGGPSDMEEARNILDAQEEPSYDNLEGLVDEQYFEAQNDGHDPELEWEDPHWPTIVKDMQRHWNNPEPDNDPREFIQRLRENHPAWMRALRESVPHLPNTADIRAHILDRDRDEELEKAVAEMFPGAAHPNPLFQPLELPETWDAQQYRNVTGPPTADSYAYPVTEPGLGLGAEDQYLSPIDKEYFRDRALKNRMRDMRNEGTSWNEIAARHGAGGYADDNNPAQRAFREVRDEEYQIHRQQYRNYRSRAQNLQEANAPGDTFEPYSMQELNNQAHQMHWQDMVNSGLTHDQASQRVIEYDRRIRNAAEHCNVCGDYGDQHAHGCPVLDYRDHPDLHAPQQPLPEEGRIPPWGTFSRVGSAWTDADPREAAPWS